MAKLTPKQSRFVKEYLVDLNSAAAARRAGYSTRTAGAIGQENLTKPAIAAAIQKGVAKRDQRTEYDADRVLLDLVAFSNLEVTDFYDESGKLLPIEEMPVAARRLLRPVHLKNGKVRYRVHELDPIRLLELMGKHTRVAAWEKDTAPSVPVVIVRDFAGSKEES